MSHEYNDPDWEYDANSVQRGGVTGEVSRRRYGEVSHPEPTDGDAPNDDHEESEGGFDADGIPEGI
jgi:hypothetical protein